MEKTDLSNLNVAVVLTDGFEQVEMTEPKKALEQAGAKVKLIAPKKGKIKSWKHLSPAEDFDADMSLDEVNPNDFQALMLPGGVINPDALRIVPGAIAFIKTFVDAKKPIAAICHGPWTLINAGAVKGRKMTSWPSLAIDLKNGGANWVDEEVVRDGNIVTSRKPADIPAFNREMINLFASSIRQAGE